MKKRKHTFTITVTFDKACTELLALSNVADSIHGKFYPTQFTDDQPGEFKVNRFGRLPRQVKT